LSASAIIPPASIQITPLPLLSSGERVFVSAFSRDNNGADTSIEMQTDTSLRYTFTGSDANDYGGVFFDYGDGPFDFNNQFPGGMVLRVGSTNATALTLELTDSAGDRGTVSLTGTEGADQYYTVTADDFYGIDVSQIQVVSLVSVGSGAHTFSIEQGLYDWTPDIARPINLEKGYIDNDSYETECAEVDNINIPLHYENASSYRITVKHPEYAPTTINERGPNFDNCTFTDRVIWQIGDNDGSFDELRPSGFENGDEYFAPDHPAAGQDELWSEFPREINHDWCNDQYIRFTADEDEDVNLEIRIGAKLTLDMAMINGTLEIEVLTWSGSTWIGQGSRVFDADHLTQNWDIPDFTWLEGTDANNLRFRVVRADEGGDSTPGAWAYYDYIELRKRDEGGETIHPPIYDDGNVIIEAVTIDFWWRAPQSMTVTAIGGETIENVHYFRIIKRSPRAEAHYSQIFVLYEDGNARLLPHPFGDTDWVPFGTSIILGPTEDVDRPFAGIKEVTIDPADLSMDISYDLGGSCHVELWVDDEQHVVDVTDIQYDTTSQSFARVRSMWVHDGEADLDRVRNKEGAYHLMHDWTTLEGPWWEFYKEVPTYHNTYCPDFRIEVTGPTKAYYVRQAESANDGARYEIVSRSGAQGGKAIQLSATDEAEVTFDVELVEERPDTHIVLRYSDDDGGNNGDFPGNLIEVYVDGVLKGSTRTQNTAGWNDFEDAPSIPLGDLDQGVHSIKIVTGSGTFGLELDAFQLISYPRLLQTQNTVLTRQGENVDAGSGYVIESRGNAEDGQSLHLGIWDGDWVGGSAVYNVELAADATSSYLRVRYSDDVGPTKVEIYVDGLKAAQFPTEHTGGWNEFTDSADIYIGNLAAGTHQVEFVGAAETYGMDIDKFEIYTNSGPHPPVGLDADKDNIDDQWELQYFGTLVANPTDDPDRDGVNNIDEFIAGTDPMGNVSVSTHPHIVSINKSPSDGAMIIELDTVPYRQYTIRYSDDGMETWELYSNIDVGTWTSRVFGKVIFSDTFCEESSGCVPPNGSRMYRIYITVLN
jgi:hypothetical protein